MTEVQNRNGEVRDLEVTGSAGVVTMAATDVGNGSRVTTFLMGETQAASLRDDLAAVVGSPSRGPASAPVSRPDRPLNDAPLHAHNSQGDREVRVSRDSGEVVVGAYDCNRRRVGLRMTPEMAAELGYRLLERAGVQF